MGLSYGFYYGNPSWRFDLEMSVAPVVVICSICGGSGAVLRYMPLNECQRYFRIEDTCDRCGGSGRVLL